mgnify:CR=1 FL=1
MPFMEILLISIIIAIPIMYQNTCFIYSFPKSGDKYIEAEYMLIELIIKNNIIYINKVLFSFKVFIFFTIIIMRNFVNII